MTDEINNPICFVGAGPGDIELITVKGRRLLDEADCIVYAGSLVNPELLKGSKADVYDSKGMDLEQIVDVMQKAWKKGGKLSDFTPETLLFLVLLKNKCSILTPLKYPILSYLG